jgi:two-component system, OmpR family, copper resistance phosphate regulon response regulator CusR
MHKELLVIEDEIKVANFIKVGLEENQYHVTLAYDGNTGLELAIGKYFDVIILDIGLPDINGFEVCKKIREVNSVIPILMLTALGSTDNKLNGFDSGTDDYLIKPFEFLELLARIRALIKRSQSKDQTINILRVSDLELNRDAKEVKRANIKIDLTPKEFFLLEYLMQNKGKVISRVEIAEKIWDITFDTGTNVIDVYVNLLRKKIDKEFPVKLIHTVFGMGYVLKEE